MIKTFSHVVKRIPQARLYLVGIGWGNTKTELTKLAEAFGIKKNIIFTGEVGDKELMNYYSKCEYFVSSSEYEGFGISVLEAMGTGYTVIVNNIEAYRNFIKDKQNGFIIDYSNHEKAAAQILKITDKNNSSIIKNAKKTAEKYGWNELVKKVEEIYKAYMVI